jgi:hypothetical protein
MGWIEMPDRAPAEGGKVQMSLVLDPQELRDTVDLLKNVLSEYTSGMSNGISPAQAVQPHRPAVAGPSSEATPSPQPLPVAMPAGAHPQSTQLPLVPAAVPVPQPRCVPSD